MYIIIYIIIYINVYFFSSQDDPITYENLMFPCYRVIAMSQMRQYNSRKPCDDLVEWEKFANFANEKKNV